MLFPLFIDFSLPGDKQRGDKKTATKVAADNACLSYLMIFLNIVFNIFQIPGPPSLQQ